MTLVKLSYNSKLVPYPGLVLQTPLCVVSNLNNIFPILKSNDYSTKFENPDHSLGAI